MSGEEAKIVLKGMVGIMRLASMQRKDATLESFLTKVDEAVEVSCAAIDMVNDRLDIDGGKNE